MTIYFIHSLDFDYQSEFYLPLRNSTLSTEQTLILPHESSSELSDSKESLKKCDLVIAEVSIPKIGVGIELGWADMLGVPIVAVYKNGSKLSSSLNAVTQEVFEYASTEELIAYLEKRVAEKAR